MIHLDTDTKTLTVCGQRFPVVECQSHDEPYVRRWALLRFETGWRVSVVYGFGSYSVNRNAHNVDDLQEPSPDCEIMVAHENEGVVDWGGDEVMGWVTAEELRGLISLLNSHPDEIVFANGPNFGLPAIPQEGSS